MWGVKQGQIVKKPLIVKVCADGFNTVCSEVHGILRVVGGFRGNSMHQLDPTDIVLVYTRDLKLEFVATGPTWGEVGLKN